MDSDAPPPQEGEPAKKKTRGWAWLLSLYMVWNVVGQHVISWALDGLVSLGGYGFSNAFLGMLALGGSFIVIQRRQVYYEKMQAQGDPNPLPRSVDYATQAQIGLFVGWSVGILGWGWALGWLVYQGPAPALVLAPIVGTAAVMAGRAGMTHARAMDARSDRPPTAGAV